MSWSWIQVIFVGVVVFYYIHVHFPSAIVLEDNLYLFHSCVNVGLMIICQVYKLRIQDEFQAQQT